MTHKDPAIEAKAREYYEASRKKVGGRPPWERLNPLDEYDMGMKQHAYRMAERAAASAIEARSGETQRGSTEGESATPQGDAQT